MIEILYRVVQESAHILNESALYIMFGLFIAGLLKAFMPEDFVARHLGNSSLASVAKASLLGIPLPLCSCGVVPAAMGLRKSGASRGATVSFLISTPETGVDSIAVTYALLDPFMTVIRPVSAFITSTIAGIFVNFLPESDLELETEKMGKLKQNKVQNDINQGGGWGCSSSCGAGENDINEQKNSFFIKFKKGFDFAFGELLSDIGPWLLMGIVIAGAISGMVPDGMIEKHLGDGFKPMLIMLIIGMPVFVCATASTPIVAALALKGLSPGAALVFLLAGPVTNAATITVLVKILGKKVAVIYVAVIASISLTLGVAVNYIYGLFAISTTDWVHGIADENHGLLAIFMSVLLVVMVIRSMIIRFKSNEQCRDDIKIKAAIVSCSAGKDL